MGLKSFIDEGNDKFNSFPLWKKLLSVFFVVLVIFSIFLIINNKNIMTYTYPSGCKEVYINGVLNNSLCVYDREKADKSNFRFDLNISNNVYK